jgi:uncharacterized protein
LLRPLSSEKSDSGELLMGNVETIQAVYEAFNKGDIERVLSLFDPNIEWFPAEGHPYAPEEKRWVGTDTLLREFFMKFGPQWDGFRCNVGDYHDAGEAVVVEGRYGGLHKASGKRLDAQFCHVWKLRDGKVTRFRQYMDTAQVQDAVTV